MVMIGLDSVEISLIREGLDEGWLPTFRDLLSSGRIVDLKTSSLLGHPAYWASLLTGADVQVHQRVYHQTLRPGSYQIEDASAETWRSVPFWNHISDAGLRSTIASPYAGRTEPGFNGTVVVGWGTHDPDTVKYLGPWSQPPEVLKWLEEEIGRRPVLAHVDIPQTADEVNRIVAAAVDSAHLQGQSLKLLMERTEWDFFFAGFTEAHQLGHILWHTLDPTHARHDPSAPDNVREAMKTVYAAIDAAVADVLSAIPSDVTVLVLSPHGMSGNPGVAGVAEMLLEKKGWLVRPPVSAGLSRRRALWTARQAIHKLMPFAVRRFLGNRIPRLRRRMLANIALANIDWDRTVAFELPYSEGLSAIRINLQGREPAGVVRPGKEYDRLLTEMADFFSELVDPDTGRAAIAEVERVDKLIGQQVEDVLPDLIADWTAPLKSRRLGSGSLGEIDLPSPEPQTGRHIPRGFIIGRGAGIIPGQDVDAAAMTDVAPTILMKLGVSVPADLPGKPIDSFM